MGLSTEIARHVATTQFEDLPPAAIAAAKNSLLDAIGVTLAATGLSPECLPFVELATESGGRPQATIIGHGFRTSASMAAFANGAMAHALDYEDAHDGSLTHPNAQMVPAALALAEATGAAGRELAAALVVGCDLVCRLGQSINVSIDSYGWYPPPILGGYGAAAAAGRLLKLSPDQMLDAFSLVLCQATCSAELKYSPRSTIRAVRDAFFAQAGVVAALLAHKGVKGFDLPFEGKAGFFALYARGEYEPDCITATLGKVYEGTNVSYKAWPACRGTHAYIEAAQALVQQQDLQPERIAHITMHGSPVNLMLSEPRAQKLQPQTAIDAKFSLPYIVASTMIHGAIELDSFLPAAISDAAVAALAQRTSYVIDPALSKTIQDATRGLLQVALDDGRMLEYGVDYPFGHPRNPMHQEQLISKFKDCGRHAAQPLSEQALCSVVDDVLTLESLPSIASLMAHTVPSGHMSVGRFALPA